MELRPYWECLIKAAEIFEDANKLLSHSDLKDLLSTSLFGRAYSCFLGAVRLSCGGQITESCALLRVCLENSLYAFYIAENPKFAKVWTDRHESDDQKRACKQVFVIGAIWKALNVKSQTIKKEAKDLYESSIDFGAHPNERSLFMNLEKKQNSSGLTLNILNPDETFMRAGLCHILLTVSTVFKIFSLIFPEELNKANIEVKIYNLNKQMQPLLFAASQQLRKHK